MICRIQVIISWTPFTPNLHFHIDVYVWTWPKKGLKKYVERILVVEKSRIVDAFAPILWSSFSSIENYYNSFPVSALLKNTQMW